ncbi:CcoQ/FixQ family Cbb3-type cytochrome c oxidase assembly chaperone [Massilia sp. TS11]|uniref:cbb3-type cytochrome oxidase subunit 3 n=1 Tax=Massilia sp. TS11 TaxID=2908003 RepID=UPI001EDBDC59|nr:CcoQ/FixQ family Cbb3-type cytochrome c oxidase assembly chaperone [Massilia sp. TS11]MCG2583994.1 cbb3-type cytochrome c oxidase subunit 3 [Massilia sp. TS11]
MFNINFSDASTITTLISFITFVGIVVWTYSHSNADFDRAAALPFADEAADKENVHG